MRVHGDRAMTQPSVMTRVETEAGEHGRLQSRAAFADESRGRERPFEEDVTDVSSETGTASSTASRSAASSTRRRCSRPGGRPLPHTPHPHAGSVPDRPHDSSGAELNEDLTEAIALAHDLGHTPFGHRARIR